LREKIFGQKCGRSVGGHFFIFFSALNCQPFTLNAHPRTAIIGVLQGVREVQIYTPTPLASVPRAQHTPLTMREPSARQAARQPDAVVAERTGADAGTSEGAGDEGGGTGEEGTGTGRGKRKRRVGVEGEAERTKEEEEAEEDRVLDAIENEAKTDEDVIDDDEDDEGRCLHSLSST